MMKLNGYDTEFKFLKVEKLAVADTISRAYVKVTYPAENRLNVFSMKIKDLQNSRLKEFENATDKDPDLKDWLILSSLDGQITSLQLGTAANPTLTSEKP